MNEEYAAGYREGHQDGWNEAVDSSCTNRTWIGLTDEQIWQLVNDCVLGGDLHPDKFARAIEAELKEKNNAN